MKKISLVTSERQATGAVNPFGEAAGQRTADSMLDRPALLQLGLHRFPKTT
jgi:hypothetical protein